MTYTLALVEDETLEYPDSQFMILGISDSQVIRAVVNYLRRAQPETSAGGRLDIDKIGAESEWGWAELVELVEDLPYIALSWWSRDVEGAGRVHTCSEFLVWTDRHARDLAAGHAPWVAQDPVT